MAGVAAGVVAEGRRPGAAVLAGLGIASVVCWWQIRRLGDVRYALWPFYGWLTAAFLCYLVTLWWIRRQEGIVSSRRALIGGVGWIIVVAGLLRGLMVGATPTLSDDIYRYRWDGRVQQAGIDPYRYPPTAPELSSLRDAAWTRINFPTLRTVYPPITELAFRAGVALGPDAAALKMVFVAAEGVIAWALLVLLIMRGASPLWVAAYAWHPLAVLEIAGSGHNDALGIALLWAGLAGWQARRPAAAAVGWALAVLARYLAVILVPWWWFRRTARGPFVLFLGMAALPLVWHPAIGAALVESLRGVAVSGSSNASVYRVVAWLLHSDEWARWVVVGAWTGFLLWWGRREPDPIRYLFGGLALAALLSPALHPWYVVWLIPFFCFWRVAPLMALTATVTLAYTIWPGFLRDGRWQLPVWAQVAEYAPVVLLGSAALWRSKGIPAGCRTPEDGHA